MWLGSRTMSRDHGESENVCFVLFLFFVLFVFVFYVCVWGGEDTFVNCGHLKIFLLLPDLKVW